MAKTLSGITWVQKFPTSKSTDDLEDTFKTNVNKFIAALKKSGATVSVNATKRPKERAYLMHWCFKISAGFDPEKVPAMAGVDIEWVHRDAAGKVNGPVSKTHADLMVAGYDIAFEPALITRHSEGKAIDMDIAWTSKELTITDGAGKDVTIKTGNKNGSNTELHKVGASYNVIKLVKGPFGNPRRLPENFPGSSNQAETRTTGTLSSRSHKNSSVVRPVAGTGGSPLPHAAFAGRLCRTAFRRA